VGVQFLAQQRLRGLTITFVLIVLLMLFWKYAVVGDPDPTQSVPYSFLLVVLGGIIVRLSKSRPLSPSMLEALELGMIGTFAAVFAVAQYQTMLDFSLRGDPARAQLVMSHRVQIATILILSYGIYAPASWRRAAAIVGPIAVLPFATLLLLYLRHPRTMAW